MADRKDREGMKTIKQENINYGFKYIARDEDDTLFIYTDRPYKKEKWWRVGFGAYCHRLKYENDFTRKIKWEDEEPTQIVRREPLYYIKLLDNNSSYVIRNNDTGKIYINHKQDLKHCYLQSKFTVEEIEELNPAYVPFAVPVEDE